MRHASAGRGAARGGDAALGSGAARALLVDPAILADSAVALAASVSDSLHPATASDSLVWAAARDIEAEVAWRHGDRATADSLARELLALRAACTQHDSTGLARTRLTLAYVSGDSAAFAQTFAVLDAQARPDSYDVAMARHLHGAVLYNQGYYAEAREEFRRAFDVRHATLPDTHISTLASRRNYAICTLACGQPEAARPLLLECVPFYRQIDPRVAHGPLEQLFANLVTADERLGLFAAAGADAESALVHAAARRDSLSLDALNARVYSAYAPLVRGDVAGATTRLRDAARLAAIARDARPLSLAWLYLGHVEWLRGHLAAADSAYRQAYDAVKDDAARLHDVRATEYPLRVAALAGFRGDLTTALRFYDIALASCSQPTALDTLIQADIRGQRAQSRLFCGDTTGVLADAVFAHDTATRYISGVIRTLSEDAALSFRALQVDGTDALCSRAEHALRPAERRQLWDALARRRGLVLEEFAQRHRLGASTADARTRAIAESLTTLLAEGAAGLDARDGAGDTSRTSRLVQLQRALLARDPVYARDRALAATTLDSLRAALPPGAALIAFQEYRHLGPDATGGATREPTAFPPPITRGPRRYLAMVLRADGAAPRTIPLGDAATLDRAIATWRQLLSPAGRPAALGLREWEARTRRAGAVVAQRLWAPLRDATRGARLLFLVPDGAVTLVDFDALPVGASGYRVDDASDVHYLSTERDLVRWRHGGARGERLLVVDDPAYDAPREDAACPADSAPAPCAWTALRFPPLAAARAEARDILALWSQGTPRRPATRLDGKAATEPATVAALRVADVCHLATHGYFTAACADDDTSPLSIATPGTRAVAALRGSGVALASANRLTAGAPATRCDGLLTADELSDLDLSHMCWAVLSACETGVGTPWSGEGVFGMRRALDVAGVHTTLMSLWDVPDETTRAWMARVYRARFVEGASTAGAVHRAMRDELTARRRAGGCTHPALWAGFVAAGDWH